VENVFGGLFFATMGFLFLARSARLASGALSMSLLKHGEHSVIAQAVTKWWFRIGGAVFFVVGLLLLFGAVHFSHA